MFLKLNHSKMSFSYIYCHSFHVTDDDWSKFSGSKYFIKALIVNPIISLQKCGQKCCDNWHNPYCLAIIDLDNLQLFCRNGYSSDLLFPNYVFLMLMTNYLVVICPRPLLSENNVQEELFDQILRGKLEFPSPDWDDISLPAKVRITQTDRKLNKVNVYGNK